MTERHPLDYKSAGVNYEAMDPFKRHAQMLAVQTAHHLKRHGMKEVPQSRGESAYVWDRGFEYMTKVIEGLGTKNLVADILLTSRIVEGVTGKTYYDAIAQDTFAMIVNDLVTVGGVPEVVDQYVAVGESSWFENEERSKQFLEGWKRSCDIAKVTWGGGETPTLSGIIVPGTVDLAGSAVGSIRPKERLILGKNLKVGDAMIGIESSGIHANGLTLARKVADRLSDGYKTKMKNSHMYGEALLRPTIIYSPLVEGLQEAGVKIHYIVNVTGHGFRKVMRHPGRYTYKIEKLPIPQPEFDVIQKIAEIDDREMYGNYNMGIGYILFVDNSVAQDVIEITNNKLGFKADIIGKVEEGPRQVVLQPLNNLTYKELGVR